MKLSKINEALYNMGDSSILTEAVTNAVFVQDKDTGCFISKYVDWGDPDSLFTEPDNIDDAMLFPKYSWMEEVQEYLDELTDGSYSVDDFVPVDHFEYRGQSFEESLNEGIGEVVQDRFEKLNNLRKAVTKALSGIDVMNSLEKLKNYVTVLEWIYKIGTELKRSDENTVGRKLKYIDHYINQIYSSVESGQPVQESLLTESFNKMGEVK